MPNPITFSGCPYNTTSTAQLLPAVTAGQVIGFYVNSTTNGTLVFRRGTSAGTALGTITPAVGWHFYPLETTGGIHVTIANTLDVTVFIQS